MTRPDGGTTGGGVGLPHSPECDNSLTANVHRECPLSYIHDVNMNLVDRLITGR